MKFIFEVSMDGEEWKSISEQIFYESLYRHLNKITPLIRDMLKGKEVVYGNTRYRIVSKKDD